MRWSLRDSLFTLLVAAGTLGLLWSRSAPHSIPAGLERQPGDPASPILVELFTSEGCSSCPPADRLLQQLLADQPVEEAVLLGLGQHVDYWDRLGWKDRFSDSKFTNRQRRYAASLRLASIYTPQIVIDGRFEAVGSDRGKVLEGIRKAAGYRKGKIELTATDEPESKIRLALVVDDLPPSEGEAELYVAVAEHGLWSQVTRGENEGRRLHHAAVVRSLESAGRLPAGAGPHKAATVLKLGDRWERGNLRLVAWVQDSRMRVLAAATLPLSSGIG